MFEVNSRNDSLFLILDDKELRYYPQEFPMPIAMRFDGLTVGEKSHFVVQQEIKLFWIIWACELESIPITRFGYG